jgi:hypothetical protein
VIACIRINALEHLPYPDIPGPSLAFKNLGGAVIAGQIPAKQALGDQESLEILRHALAYHPWVQLRVTGGCMMPDLLPGEIIRLVPAAIRPPRWGDIVLAISPEGIRLHRLVWNFASLTLTKADRSRAFDGTRLRDAILASVAGVDRPAGSADPEARSRSRALRSLVGGLLTWARRRARRAMGRPW